MNLRYLILISLILLTGCSSEFEREEAPVQPAEERSEDEAMTAGDEVMEDENSERLLETGMLEIGNADAPVTLLVFTEHHCKYCREFMRDQVPWIKEEYIDPGNLKLQIVIFPLKKYLKSKDAAAALYCGSAQGSGLSLHDLLFRGGNFGHESLLEYANSIELDTELFDECLTDEQTQLLLDEQKVWARSLDVSLVPTFFLNGKKLVGLQYEPDLRGMIENEIE